MKLSGGLWRNKYAKCLREVVSQNDTPHSKINRAKRNSEWWQGAHLQFHIVKRGNENHLGDIVFMDEYLGKDRRLTCCSSRSFARCGVLHD